MMNTYKKQADDRYDTQMVFLEHFIQDCQRSITNSTEEQELEAVIKKLKAFLASRLKERVTVQKPTAALQSELGFWINLAKEATVTRPLVTNAFLSLKSRGMDFLTFDVLVDGLPVNLRVTGDHPSRAS